MRVIGMDIHRSFAQVAILEEGQIREECRVDLVHHRFMDFARTLRTSDEVVIEATGNSAAVERLLRPFVKRVAVANPRLVKAIAYARVKTDKVDAKILAKLHAAGFLPEVWVPDEVTLTRRRQIAERMGVLAQLYGQKGRIQALLHANLIPQYKGHLFGPAGRLGCSRCRSRARSAACWDAMSTSWGVSRVKLANLDKVLAQQALDDPRAKRLMTILQVSARWSPPPSWPRSAMYVGFRHREAEQLLRPDAADPPVRRSSGSAWADHQTREP